MIGDLVTNAMGSVSQIPAATIAAVPQTVEAPVAAAPVMTAAASTDALSATEAAVALTGDGTGEPAVAPLVWAAVAASRQEDLAGAKPEVPAAATTSTAAPADPAGTTTVSATAGAAAASAAATGAAAAAKPTIVSFTPGAGFVGDPVTITGTNFTGLQTVEFCSNSSYNCNKGVKATVTGSTDTAINVTVPSGIETGTIRVTTSAGNVTSSQKFTINAPQITSFSPTAGPIGSPVVITGNFFQNASSVKFCGSKCASGIDATYSVSSDGTQITATVPTGAATGVIQVTTPSGVVSSSANFGVGLTPLPALPPCQGSVCGLLTTTFPVNVRTLVINQLATTVVKALASTGPALPCTKDGCPIPSGQTTTSVADTIGMYGFNVIYALSDPNNAEAVGDSLAALVTQPNVLAFISDTVSSNPLLPPDLAATVGDAAATFVQESFGNPEIATAFAPFLYSLGVPTTTGQAATFTGRLAAGDSVTKILLDTFDTDQGQEALINDFFGNTAIQPLLGNALASAVNVLLDSSALPDYLGQTAADQLLGVGSPYSAALSTTIGDAFTGLFSSISAPVDASISSAFQAFLNAPIVPGQETTPAILSDAVVNALYSFLQGPEGTKPLPFPNQQPLNLSLAPAVGVGVTEFVNSMFDSANYDTVTGGLNQFVTQLIPGVLGNEGVQ
ncbi:MAG: hypothetical protein ACR2JM_09960, partial [Mycobacterium sp.]